MGTISQHINFYRCLMNQCSDNTVNPEKYPKNIFLNRAGPTRKLIRVILFYILLHNSVPSVMPKDSAFVHTFFNIVSYFAALLIKFFFSMPWSNFTDTINQKLISNCSKSSTSMYKKTSTVSSKKVASWVCNFFSTSQKANSE